MGIGGVGKGVDPRTRLLFKQRWHASERPNPGSSWILKIGKKQSGFAICIAEPRLGSTKLSYLLAIIKSDKGLQKQELKELEKSFRSFIQPHLNDKDSEDFDLVWQWQKFLYDKGQRVQESQRD
jgi:hypothetical protein